MRSARSSRIADDAGPRTSNGSRPDDSLAITMSDQGIERLEVDASVGSALAAER